MIKLIQFIKDIRSLRKLQKPEDFGPAWDNSKLKILKKEE